MQRENKQNSNCREVRKMKIIYWIFFILGICFCVVGASGHVAAWSAAALCFFAATMIVIRQRNK